MVGFVESVKLFYSRALDFNGRSSRSEYWWPRLFMFIALLLSGAATGAVVAFLGFRNGFVEVEGLDGLGGFSGLGGLGPVGLTLMVITGVVALAHLLPSIALSVRRLHDLNQTGWLYLAYFIISFLPIIGWLAFGLMTGVCCFRGTDGPNKYGSDPLERDFDRGF